MTYNELVVHDNEVDFEIELVAVDMHSMYFDLLDIFLVGYDETELNKVP